MFKNHEAKINGRIIIYKNSNLAIVILIIIFLGS
jgi:hypothetical protein